VPKGEVSPGGEANFLLYFGLGGYLAGALYARIARRTPSPSAELESTFA
jgi:hypothetical protein